MRIIVTGSTGLIGSAIVSHFEGLGHSLTRLVRRDSKNDSCKGARWDIPAGEIESSALEGHDVCIHLAGANLADRRWSARYKEVIRSSRRNGTLLLSQTLARLNNPPRVLLSASAIGYYGNIIPPQSVDELANMGSGFLSGVCSQWEMATKPAEEAGIRVVHMRFGVILSEKAGALAKMLPVFKLGLGGRIGSGRQMTSWIAIDEIPLIIEHLIKGDLSGPVNIVSPSPVSNEEFTMTLARCLNRKVFFPIPSLGIRFLLGEMGEALLLSGAAVEPRRLKESGYDFRYPDLETALSQILRSQILRSQN